jgi:hypothetical protein
MKQSEKTHKYLSMSTSETDTHSTRQFQLRSVPAAAAASAARLRFLAAALSGADCTSIVAELSACLNAVYWSLSSGGKALACGTGACSN